MTWSQDDYIALRNYELRRERREQITRLEERYEAGAATDLDAAEDAAPSEESGVTDGD